MSSTVNELHATLQQGFEDLCAELKQGTSERLLAYLRFGAKFHRYSPANQWLIFIESTRRGIEPSYVAGFSTWKRLNYAVRKGEKGLPIFAPRPYTAVDEESGKEERRIWFKVAYVFADCQVEPMKEGMPPFPQFFTPLEGDAERLVERLRAVIHDDGIVISERALPLGVQGTSERGRISLRPGLASLNSFLTLTHELLHKGCQLAKAVKECQAEAVAYLVAHHFGIHSPFSSDYLHSWGNDAAELLTEIEPVQRTALLIISRMEEPFQPANAPELASTDVGQ